MSPAFSPTRYVISTRRKAKRELLLLPAMNDTIGQLDQPEFCPTFQRDNLHRHFRVRVFSRWVGDRRSDAGCHSQVVVLVPGADAVSSAEGDTAA
jgi:hypothetical protein